METSELIRMLRAAGEPRRLEILDLLARRPAGGQEILAAVPVSQPNLSRHLKVLREAGLVAENRCGRSVTYTLAGGDFVAAVLGLLGREVHVTPDVPGGRGERAVDREGRGELPEAGRAVPARPDRGPEPAEPTRKNDFEEWLL